MIKKSGSAYWHGGIKDGGGTISTQTGVLKEAPYGFKARFEGGPGTNPEELIGAAHAGCFSMALSLVLGNAGMTADSIRTTATVSLDQEGDGFAIKAVHLDTTVKVSGAEKAAVEKAIQDAKAGCPVSKLMKAEITIASTVET
jgi:osmotically inducible protein OsmC